jgi:hypothetical protein
MQDENHAPVCGVYCGDCNFLNEQCKGCGYENGKPFWTVQIPSGICPLHNCCRNQKYFEHCGLCDGFPCEVFLELRDPNMSDEEFKTSLEERQRSLKRRTQIGTDKWLQEMCSRYRIRLDCESEANHNLNRLLDKPG